MILNGYQGNFAPRIVTSIAQGAQESSAIRTSGMSLVGIQVPAVLTGTALSFTVGDAADGFQASGQVAFSGTTANNDTLTINSVVITFKTVLTTGNQVLIGGTAAETASNLYDFLIASQVAGLLACTYELEGALVLVTAVVHGTAGNAYTFAKSSSDIALSPAGGTLTGGGFRPLYDSTNTLISYTVAAGRTYAIPPTNFQGLEYFKLKSGSVELAARALIVSLKGI